MKSIGQIFKYNKSLMDEPEVEELIEYCRELEGQVMECNLTSNYNRENDLIQIIRDIHISCNELSKKENDRFDEDEIDYKEAIINLNKFIIKLCDEYKIRL